MITIDKKLIENLAALAALGVVVAGCIMILLPFVTALIWAGIFVFSTRHWYWKLNHALKGRNWLAAIIFVSVVFGLVFAPIIYAVISFGHIVGDFALRLSEAMQQGLPPLPEWITQTSWIGPKLSEWWGKLAASNDPAVKEQLRVVLLWFFKMMLNMGVAISKGIALLLMSFLISLFFYASLPTVTAWLQTAVQRVSGSRAEQMLDIAGKTIQSVVFGIIGTAIVQGFLTGFALLIAGVPYAAGLTFLAMILALFPFGTFFIWGPAALWLYHQGDVSMMLFVLIWGAAIVGSADNVIKPLVIGRNSDLPFILILIGILGGVIQFGPLGVFLGPTLIAMGYALSKEWLMGIEQKQEV